MAKSSWEYCKNGHALATTRFKDSRGKFRCRTCHTSYIKNWDRSHPNSRHAFMIKHTYGLTQLEYEDMLCKQDYKCLGCGVLHTNTKRLAVDHDHRTGKVRGLLCRKCNSVLGFVNDDIQILARLQNYLSSLYV